MRKKFKKIVKFWGNFPNFDKISETFLSHFKKPSEFYEEILRKFFNLEIFSISSTVVTEVLQTLDVNFGKILQKLRKTFFRNILQKL